MLDTDFRANGAGTGGARRCRPDIPMRPEIMPLPGEQTVAILGYAMVACLVVNDTIKVVMIKWRVPLAVA